MNGVSDKVSVVKKDISLLERGKEVRYLGANLAIGDIFDAGKLPCHSATQSLMICTCGRDKAGGPVHALQTSHYLRAR